MQIKGRLYLALLKHNRLFSHPYLDALLQGGVRMLQLEHVSNYRNRVARSQDSVTALRDLVPDDYEHGWHVARNPHKPLNHLDFLRRKEEIAIELNLHSIHTRPRQFNTNYAILAKHQARQIPTADVITHLAHQLAPEGMSLSEDDIAARLCEYAGVRHCEFHPTDSCNLSCRGCTYGHDDPKLKPLPVHFPFQNLPKIAQLKPRSLVIAGGGEPTLYADSAHRFQEMVEKLCATNPGIVLALVTNGTSIPPGDWADRFSWIRLSLDAATDVTYSTFRGRPLLDRVLRNYLRYLDADVRWVGVSFLFARSNVHDYASVAGLIFELVRGERPEMLHKVNIQYRPLRRDPSRSGAAPSQAVTPGQIQTTVREIRALADSSPEMSDFMRNQTNITAILGGNAHPPRRFSRCYYSQTFRIVRADGDLRPCCVHVSEPGFSLGNIHLDRLEAIALNTLFIGARRKPSCNPRSCRQSHINYTFEQGLKGHLSPSTSPEVLADPMY
jgi:MoaA/NifB/PqqE/SkfB family radical SAM enzyme